ncbi:MAG: translocation/assembly module TamB domain-containing protein, partial [Desulfurivibrionaceae bacterium]|nr:translocation/assembly module TamB domain-containing protein [Desulfurivibrionaceae bacterium]
LGEKRYQLEAEAQATMGTASLAGTLEIDPQTAIVQLNRLSLARQERHLDLSQPATLLLDQNQQRLQIDNLTLAGSTESITIQGALGGALENDLQITATGLESRGWLSSRADQDYLFSGGSAKIAITGNAAAPRITATGAAARVEFPHLTAPLQGSFAVDIAKSGIVIHKFAWQNKNNQHLAAQGQLPYDPFAQKILATPLDLQVDFNLPQTRVQSGDSEQEQLASGNLTALLSLSGTLQKPQGRFTAEIKDLALPFLPAPLTHELFSARCNIRLAEDQLTIKTLQLEARDFVINGAGTWTGLTDLGDLLATDAIQSLPGDLDIRLTTQMVDIGWLTAKNRTIRRLKGQVEATLEATGPAADPALSGTLLLRDGELRVPTILPAMESITAQVSLDDHTVQVDNLSGQLGGAPFSLSGSLSRQKEGVQVDARLEGENILFFRDQDMKIRGDTILTLKGALAQMHLAGDIWLTDSRYTRNVDFLGFLRQSAPSPKPQGELFSLSEPPWRDMQFQVRIHSREPFELQNNLARGSLRPELLLAGTGELPVLTGEVYVDPIRIRVPAGRIMVDGGLIRFSQEQPDLPTFNLSGSARLAGYDISMQIQGTAAEPVIILSSIPPLPEDELLLLVLTGTPPSSGTGQGRESVAAMNMAIYLGKGLLADWFGGDPLESDESVLDRFELNIGRSITRSGENTVEAQFRLADGILYPSDHLFLTSEKDVYDDVNAGIKIIFRFQ